MPMLSERCCDNPAQRGNSRLYLFLMADDVHCLHDHYIVVNSAVTLCQ